MNINPITKTDYPDPDIIRVGDTYYMISTTMYFMPGGVILRSYDLANWEIATYIFDKLDDTASERLEGDETNYGKGMWAASLRYQEGKFYVAFVSHGRQDTHLFVADDIEGPWEHKLINGYFHDCSLLFDDGRVFVVSGNTEIRLTELEPDFSGPKEGGIDKIIIRDNREDVILGYEGAHFYKINGKYYITLIHWPKYNMRRTEAVFVSDTVDGPYVGKDVMWDDMGFRGAGVAQGGIVDTPDGKWYAILFQDSGAVGRVPVLIPVDWEQTSINDREYLFPVFGIDGKIPFNPDVKSTKPDYKYEPLFTSDDFSDATIKKQWQWNHVPNNELWKIEDNKLKVRTGKISVNPVHAQNTLTQRMFKPGCQASVNLDASRLNDGDYIGMVALQGCYGFIGICKEDSKYYLVKLVRSNIEKPFQIGYPDLEAGELLFKEEVASSVRVMLKADFGDEEDLLNFYVDTENCKAVESGDVGKASVKSGSKHSSWVTVGSSHKLKFALDHFTGARFGLCVFSTKEIGGEGAFSEFVYEVKE